MNIDNPLIVISEEKHQAIPFQTIKVEDFEPAFKYAMLQFRTQFQKIIEETEAATFQNTIEAYEKSFEPLSQLTLILFNLNSAETSEELQLVTQRISAELTRLTSEVNLNTKFFHRIESIYHRKDQLSLNPEAQYLLEETYKGMKRDGASLGDNDKAKLTQFLMELSEKSLLFDEHVLTETNDFTLHITDEKELSGLPISLVEAAAQDAQDRKLEGWVFTLQYTSYGPFMKYSDHRALRKKLATAFQARCNQNNDADNKKLVREIINLRLQVAKLLGYKNYAAYVLEEQMAELPSRVNAFLNEIHKASHKVALHEMAELQNFAQSIGFSEKLEVWDYAYFSEKLKAETYGFDEEELKSYFKLDLVIDGVFGLATRLYGLQFKEISDVPTYHCDVKTYEVYDEDGTFLSLFYADFHPRSNKQSGAWMTEYRQQSCMDGVQIRPHISICCNFTKPTVSQPSLLTFEEVETLLHEFGHALHGMLANTCYPSMSGTNVYRDFVELPSQLLENWATEKEWLDTFAIHYETGEKMPASLIDKLIAARNFHAGYASERQLSFGMTDMAWHEIEAEFCGDVLKFEQNVLTKTQLFPHMDGTSLSTAFAHIFSGGYAAGYYGYKWAEVLDADVFSVFKEHGVFNRTIANKLRSEILEKGGTKHPMKLYMNFRGKAPSIDALLERSGLKL